MPINFVACILDTPRSLKSSEECDEISRLLGSDNLTGMVKFVSLRRIQLEREVSKRKNWKAYI